MRVDVTNPIAAPGANAVSSFEAYARQRLPDSFKDFLSYGNGGSPKRSTLTVGTEERVVERFLPLIDDPKQDPAQGQYDVSVVESQIGERLACDEDQTGCVLVPFAALFGGDFLCFDYRGGRDEPSVVIWDHETSDEFAPDTRDVADSFSAFVALLR